MDAVDDGADGSDQKKKTVAIPKDYVKIRGNFEIGTVSLNLNEGKWSKEGKGASWFAKAFSSFVWFTGFREALSSPKGGLDVSQRLSPVALR